MTCIVSHSLATPIFDLRVSARLEQQPYESSGRIPLPIIFDDGGHYGEVQRGGAAHVDLIHIGPATLTVGLEKYPGELDL